MNKDSHFLDTPRAVTTRISYSVKCRVLAFGFYNPGTVCRKHPLFHIMESKHGYHLAMLISLHRINSLKSQVQHFTMTLIYMYTSLNEGGLNEGDLLNLDIKGANKPAQTNKTNKKKYMFKCKILQKSHRNQ